VLGVISLAITVLAVCQTAEARREPPSSLPGANSVDGVERMVMPDVDVDFLLAEDAERETAGRPVPARYAKGLPVVFSPASSGTWEELDDGSRLWRLRIASPGALSLSLGLKQFDLPIGAAFWVHDPGGAWVQGPYTAEDRNTLGGLWTAVVLGDELVAELHLPAGEEARLGIDLVNHGYRFFGESEAAVGAKRGACNINVICAQGDPWRNQIRSVARITFTSGASSFLCTAQLVNNTAEDSTPYLLTAQHCIDAPEVAPTIVAYWNYETSACGDFFGGSLSQNQSGAVFVASYPLAGGSDFALVDLDAEPNPSFNTYYSGWDARDTIPDSTTAIHHPGGDEKSISLDYDPPTITSYLQASSPGSGNHFRIEDWDEATTEGGSSGGCLFDDATGLCVGTLSGGYAACGNDDPDWYGRLARHWTGGGTPGSRLSDWLDPGNTGTLWVDGLDSGGSGDGCTNVLLEPGFEGGSGSAWSEYSSNGYILVTMDRPRSGSFSAWLGGDHNEESQVWQLPPIDATAISATLSYWYWIESDDVCGYDDGGVTVNGFLAGGHDFDLCLGNNTSGYVQSVNLDLLSYAATTPEIRFFATTDVSGLSSLYIDDAVLEVCVPGIPGDQIFSDGFESGDTSAWSNTVP